MDRNSIKCFLIFYFSSICSCRIPFNISYWSIDREVLFKNTILSKNRERGISSVTGSGDNPFSRFFQGASLPWRNKPPARILFLRNTLSSVLPSSSHLNHSTFSPRLLVSVYGSLYAFSSHVHRKARLNLRHGQWNIERNLIFLLSIYYFCTGASLQLPAFFGFHESPSRISRNTCRVEWTMVSHRFHISDTSSPSVLIFYCACNVYTASISASPR